MRNSIKDYQSNIKFSTVQEKKTFEKEEICFIEKKQWSGVKTSKFHQGKKIATFKVMVPTKPDLTATGSFSEFRASAFNFKSLRTTSPEKQENATSRTGTNQIKQQLNRQPRAYISTYPTLINQGQSFAHKNCQYALDIYI